MTAYHFTLACLLVLCSGYNSLGHVSERQPEYVPLLEPTKHQISFSMCPSGTSQEKCSRVKMRLDKFDINLRTQLMGKLLELCPKRMTTEECVDMFIELIANELKRIASMKGVSKRESHMSVCAGLEKLQCFESYVTLWMRMLNSQAGKRTFAPGKRSHSTWRRCPPGTKQAKCLNNLFISHIQARGMKGGKSSLAKKRVSTVIRSMPPLCPPNVKQFACFERYIRMYAYLMRVERQSKRDTKLPLKQNRIRCPSGITEANCVHYFVAGLHSRLRRSHKAK